MQNFSQEADNFMLLLTQDQVEQELITQSIVNGLIREILQWLSDWNIVVLMFSLMDL